MRMHLVQVTSIKDKQQRNNINKLQQKGVSPLFSAELKNLTTFFKTLKITNNSSDNKKSCTKTSTQRCTTHSIT